MTLLLLLLATQQPLIEVTLDPQGARTGKLFLADVVTPPSVEPIKEIAASLNGKKGIAYETSSDGHAWKIIVPVDVESALGKGKTQPLVIEATLSNGKKTTWKKPVPIKAGGYAKSAISGIGKQFMSPSKAQRQRAEKEQKELSADLATFSKERLWRGSFAKPVKGDTTSPFGTLRTYNGKRKSRHMGLDLDGNVGDPIVAANRGVVLHAKDRFYSGGTVLIDHGQGFMTMYFHMSRIDVKPGQHVEKGEGLGAVGATGQVTGPHLHFSVKLAGEYQDGAQLLDLDLSNDALDAPITTSAMP